MEAVRSRVMGVLGKKDNVVHALLLGTFVALGARSAGQQREIEALEAERTSLRAANKAMAASLWESRQHLFSLAESDPSAVPLPLARLRAIFGEDALPSSPSPAPLALALPGDIMAEDSTPIA